MLRRLVLAAGDLHGSFRRLEEFIEWRIRKDPSVIAHARRMAEEGDEVGIDILQCGDFGWFWPGARGRIDNRIPFAEGGRARIWWCAGNHEDHDALDLLFADPLQAGPEEVGEGIFFMRFGATLDLAPDIRVLFAGGAESPDRDERVRGVSWWPQEGISEEDMARLGAVDRADWVVSHAAPSSFLLQGIDERHDPSRARLEEVLRRFRPSAWLFGHFHRSMWGYADGCRWTCLNSCGGEGWIRGVPLDAEQAAVFREAGIPMA